MKKDDAIGKSLESDSFNNAPFIFLAEDDIDDQELLIEALNHFDRSVSVQSATNGKKAIIFLESLPETSLPCLIVLDYNLPELNGAQILELLAQQKRYQDIPKVVWSTSNSELFKNDCLNLGTKAYFIKPRDLLGINNLAKTMMDICNM